jgi:hypothetical protein
MVTITTMPVLETTPAFQTIPTVTVRTVAYQPGMELLPVLQQAYQEEKQVQVHAW